MMNKILLLLLLASSSLIAGEEEGTATTPTSTTPNTVIYQQVCTAEVADETTNEGQDSVVHCVIVEVSVEN